MAELKYTKHLLGKVEEIFKEIDYTIRYAKGSFQSGYCLVEQQKIVVVNKFYETEGRINVLIDILDSFTVDESVLTEKSLKTYKQVMKQKEGESEETSEQETSEQESETKVDSEEVLEDTSEQIAAAKEESEKLEEDTTVSVEEEILEQEEE